MPTSRGGVTGEVPFDVPVDEQVTPQVISVMPFRQIGRADELGSGMRKMMKYSRAYGGSDPELIEGDVFRMIIMAPEFGRQGEAAGQTAKVQAHDEAHDLSETELTILNACLSTPRSTPELLGVLGYKTRTGNYKKAIARLVDELELLEKTLPNAAQSKKQKYRLTQKGREMIIDL